MTPSFAPHRSPTASDPDLELDGFVAAFESAVAADPTADPAAFLPPHDHPLFVTAQCELVRVDLEFAWGRGDERRVEHYRERFPALFAHPPSLRAIVREEMRLRAAAGEEPEQSEYVRRFGPNWSDSGVLPKTAVVPAEQEPSRLPEPGEAVAGFVLTTELGRGAFGRVFLARQADLADRPVAVKVSAKFPGEWRTLARLQHSNIVPVYSVHRHGRFHVACMPYLGRTTLADLIRDLHANGAFPASGRVVASTLHNRVAPTSVPLSNGEPATPPATVPPAEFPPAVRERYERSSYPDWVLWLGAELADGLAHAHDRGILHRDVKPANVLLSDDGRPTLLDFNLSDDLAEGQDRWQFVGGTLRYMAPEHLAALADGQTKPDARADVYSLGLILYELLAGRLPFDDPQGSRSGAAAMMQAARAEPPADVRTFRPDVSPAVASILRTALDPDPTRRYQSAADLRDDLRRQLDHLPLKVAPDRSLRERFRKWRRRHPRLASWVTVSVLAAVVLGVGAFAYVTRHRQFQSIAAVNHLHQLADLRSEVRATLTTGSGPRAEYAEAAEKCDTLLSPLPAPTEATWTDHELIRPLKSDDRRRAAELVAELRLLRARADQLARGVLKPAELAAAARAANDPDGRYPPATSVRVAAIQMLPGLRAAARTESNRWEYWYQLGQCERVAGDFAAARSHFKLAADLDDDCPWAYYHLGTTALDAKDPKAAIAAFDRCLEIRGDVPEVYLNRALARIELTDYRGAIADLDRIEPHAERLPRLYFVREEAKRRSGDGKGADADRAAGLKLEPTDALGWNARGEARMRLASPDAKGAVADFDEAISTDPDLPYPYQNKANALSEQLNRPADALAVLDAALDRFPDYTLARAGRAVLLARVGKPDAARRDADAVLLSDPTAVVCYQVACVYLLTATSDADRAKGLDLLRRTLRLDPAWAGVMPTDPDLKAIRGSADFQKLITAASELARPTTPR